MHETCCRPRRRCLNLALSALVLVGTVLALVLATPGRNVRDDLNARADRIVASLGGRIAALEAHQAESLRYAHEKRAELATELRKEFEAAVAKGASALSAERESRLKGDADASALIAGLRRDLDAEVIASENDAFTESADFYDAIYLIQERLAKLEARKPEPPRPCPPAPVVYEWRQVGCDRLFGYQDGPVFRYVLRLGR